MKKLAKIKRTAVFVLVVMLIFALIGCGTNSTSSNNQTTGQKADQVVIAQGADALTLDPQNQSDTNTGNVVHNIFSAPLRRDKDMSIKPSLATDYKRLSDTEWELKLRQGVKFHNGEEFNADAVKFSLERLIDPKNKLAQASYFNNIKKCEVVDPLTIRFTTDGPDPIFLARMTNLLVLPPKYFAEKGVDYFSKNPVGTGPYKFVEWQKDDHITLVADPNFYLGKPAISNVIFRAVPEMATRIAGLAGGQIDIIMGIPSDQVASLKSNNNLKVVADPSALIQMINFNPLKAPANIKEFRLAVASAINVEPIAKDLLGGYATQIDVPISTTIPNAPKDVKRIPYDPEKAKEYLKQAGLSNVEVDLNCEATRAPFALEITQVIAQQLAAVGIKANVKPVEFGQYTTSIKNKTVSPIFEQTGNNIWFDTDPQIVAFYSSTGPLSTYSNKKVDDLINLGKKTTDESKRVGIYKQAYETIRDDVGGIALIQYKNITAMNNKLDFTPRSDGRIWAFDITPAK